MAAMTTKRSLNKLEYKAHMSIHNTAEVGQSENESHESAFTRDRLGRRHKLFEGDGTSRIFGTTALSVFFLLFGAAVCWAIPENVSVSSEELEQRDFNDRLGKREAAQKFSIYDDGSSEIGFNDNGDPNVAMKF
jgi:hypothetical protein